MNDISFLAIPNIEGMRVLRYIKVFGSVLVFGVCLFFVLYFWMKYRKGNKLSQQLHIFDERAKLLEKDILVQKLLKSSGKDLLILFIEYLEKFVTSEGYANISELLLPQGFTVEDVQNIEHVLYADGKLSPRIQEKIHQYFVHSHG